MMISVTISVYAHLGQYVSFENWRTNSGPFVAGADLLQLLYVDARDRVCRTYDQFENAVYPVKVYRISSPDTVCAEPESH